MHYIEYIDKRAALNYLCDIAEKRGLSANKLVEDYAADKGNFSKMKNGQIKKVTLDLIIFLANKLGEDVEYILKETSPINPNFFEAIDSIQYYNKLRQYDTSKYLLNRIKNQFEKEMLQSIEMYQITLWSDAVIEMEANHNFYTAIDLLNKALSLDGKKFDFSNFNPQNFSEIEIGIIDAILLCYFRIDKTNSNIDKIYKRIISFLESKHIDDYEITFNVYYNYLMLCCVQNLDLNMRLELALDTAQLALDNHITNKLPFIYTQIAYIYTDLGDKENMEEYYSTAIFLYKQIGVPEAYLNKIIANREECRKIVENPEAYK